MLKKKTAMKKIYKNPEIKIVKFQTAKIIASSLNIQGNAQGSVMLSREGDSDSDDDSFGW